MAAVDAQVSGSFSQQWTPKFDSSGRQGFLAVCSCSGRQSFLAAVTTKFLAAVDSSSVAVYSKACWQQWPKFLGSSGRQSFRQQFRSSGRQSFRAAVEAQVSGSSERSPGGSFSAVDVKVSDRSGRQGFLAVLAAVEAKVFWQQWTTKFLAALDSSSAVQQ
jgi:hypothetical protein